MQQLDINKTEELIMNTTENYIYTLAKLNTPFSDRDFYENCLASREGRVSDEQTVSMDGENPLLSYYGYYSY